MNLSQIVKSKGATEPKKRVGRGYGSGRGGHTSTRGAKGQKARNSVRRYFEGGQLPLTKRLPHFATFKHTKKLPVLVQLSALNRLQGVSDVSPETLLEQGLLKKSSKTGVKIIGGAELTRAFHLKGIKVSSGVERLITSAGGSVQ